MTCPQVLCENLEEVGGDMDYIKASLIDESTLRRSLADVELVFHKAAIPSVPRSIHRPRNSILMFQVLSAFTIGLALNILW
jgi:nucleoside-diphosphate-sugar epimerase